MKVVWNGFLRKKIRGGCKRKDALDSKKRKNNNTAATADPVDWSFEISNRQLLNITKAHPKQHLKYLAHSACSSSPCVKNATCEGDFEDDPFPYRCVCPAGFTGQACQIDIDECTSNGACHVNAQCTNTPGGFNCTCKRGFFGDGKICHVARSCKGIKDLGYSRGDGEYWVDPENTGQPFIVYCDMTTDSGGWTLIKQAKINSTSPRQHGVITSTNYRDISNWRDIRYVMKSPQLQELRLAMGFHQLRFRCFKNRPGRTIHIMTTNDTAGRKVLDHFLLDATWPTACTTFQKLPDDTSILSDHCNRWGDIGNLNHWGKRFNYGDRRIYNRPFYWANKHSIAFYPENTYLCDDDNNNKETGALTIGDIWELYCR
ncbi:uncharacterized protein LOC114576277 [Exaiptasia diaphana]|uniref:Uncharacterized protein n=1 Tax=Exaiptasia diaphana TaxID=2652724 RepID=A0A913YSC6_EXADI|nr:uncharacterized protein LOC114576277 [Exaiptasia diaphana]